MSRDLLRRANDGARRVLAGQPLGTFDRWFGPFAAPQFHLHPAPWQRPATLPPLPFRALRVFVEYWDPDLVAAAPGHVPRKLLYEYTSPP